MKHEVCSISLECPFYQDALENMLWKFLLGKNDFEIRAANFWDSLLHVEEGNYLQMREREAILSRLDLTDHMGGQQESNNPHHTGFCMTDLFENDSRAFWRNAEQDAKRDSGGEYKCL